MIDPVWELYARAIRRCGPTATLLEWDDKIPSFEEVHGEALKANRFLRELAAQAAEGGNLQPDESGRTQWPEEVAHELPA